MFEGLFAKIENALLKCHKAGCSKKSFPANKKNEMFKSTNIYILFVRICIERLGRFRCHDDRMGEKYDKHKTVGCRKNVSIMFIFLTIYLFGLLPSDWIGRLKPR